MQSFRWLWPVRLLAALIFLVALSGCAVTPGREQPIGYVVSSAFSPDGRVLAAATSEGEVALFNVRPLRFTRLLTRESDKSPVQRAYTEKIGSVYRPRPVAFSRNGALLAAAGMAGGIVVWDSTSGMELFRLPATGPVVDLVFLADGQTLASVGPDILLWSLKDGGQVAKLELPLGARATAAAVSPDGMVMAAGLSTGEIALFDARTLKLMRLSKEHEAPVTGLAFQSDGGVFASTAGGYDLKLWKRVQSGEFEKDSAPLSAAASAAGTFGSAQGAGAFLWLLGTLRGFQIAGAPTLGAPPILGGAEAHFAKAARTVPPHCGSRVVFSGSGRYLASTANLMMCPDCIGTLAPAFLLFLTDLEKGTTITLRDLGCEVSMSPDGSSFAVAGPGAPQLRDITSGQPIPHN